MRRFFPGETVRVAIRFDDEIEQPVSVVGVDVLWRRADANAVQLDAGDVVQVAPGRYRADIVVTEPGQYTVRATCAAPTSAATEERFEVVPSAVLS